MLLAVWAAWVMWFSLQRAAPAWGEALTGAVAAIGQAGPWQAHRCIAAVAGHVLGIGSFAIVLLALYGAGMLVARLVFPPLKRSSSTPAALVCGFIAVALIQHGLGLAGLWFRPVLMAEAGFALAAGMLAVYRTRPWRAWRMPPLGAGLPCSIGLFGLAAAYLLTRLPDTHEDSRAYHFAAPEQWLALHRIVTDPQHFTWHLPLLAEMTYAVAWSLGGITTAKLVNLVAVLATALVLPRLVEAAIGSVRGSAQGASHAGTWAAAAWLTTGAVFDLCWQGKNDLVLVMFVVSGLWAVAEAIRPGSSQTSSGRSRWWFAAALCLGAAAAVKYSAVFFIAGTVVAVAWHVTVPRQAWRRAVPFACVPIVGWWVADWLWLGNPAHPFLTGLFPELAWNPGLQRAVHEHVLGFTPDSVKSRLDWLVAPFRLLSDVRFSLPLLAVLAPTLLWLPLRSSGGCLVTALVVAYACWLPTERLGRFLLPLVPVAIALVATAVEPWLAPSALKSSPSVRVTIRWVRRAAAAMLVVVAGLNVFSWAAPTGFLYLAGQMERDAFLRDRYTTWEDVRRWVNAQVPVPARVLFTGEERRLGFTPRVVSYGGVSEPILWKLTRDAHDPAEVRKRLRQRGLTHHLHNFVSAAYREMHWYTWTWTRWNTRQLAVYREFVARYERPVYRPLVVDHLNGGFYIFEFSRAPALSPAPVFFLPHTEGLFRPAMARAQVLDLEGCELEARLAGRTLHGVIEAQQELGNILSLLNRHADAVRAMRPGIDAGFVGDVNLETYATCLAHLGRFDESIHAICRGWQIARNDKTVADLAQILYLRANNRFIPEGKYARALRDMRLAMLLRPGEPPPLYIAAVALHRMGRTVEAIGYGQRCLAADPGNPELQAFVVGLEADLIRQRR